MSTPPKGYCATGPNQVWSWDITYLPTSVRGMFFYLYMIINVFSRKIIGWEVHHQESRFNAGILVHKAILSERLHGVAADTSPGQRGATEKLHPAGETGSIVGVAAFSATGNQLRKFGSIHWLMPIDSEHYPGRHDFVRKLS